MVGPIPHGYADRLSMIVQDSLQDRDRTATWARSGRPDQGCAGMAMSTVLPSSLGWVGAGGRIMVTAPVSLAWQAAWSECTLQWPAGWCPSQRSAPACTEPDR